MTYARARLLLGMFGVGSIVLLSVFMLLSKTPTKLLPTSTSWSGADFTALAALFACLIAILFPLDLLGGLLLPNRWRPHSTTYRRWFVGWVRGVAVQGTLFFAASLSILALGRLFGLPGAVLAVASLAIGLVAAQLRIAKLVSLLPPDRTDSPDNGKGDHPTVTQPEESHPAALTEALKLASAWGWKPPALTVLHHCDVGFTGGVVGLFGREVVVLPAESIERLSPEQLAVMIARRSEAIQSGSRTRGLLLAFAWVLVGFTLSSVLPGAGVTSVAQLATTCLGFTLWTFIGLLTLPTLSRQASHAIDAKVLHAGVPPQVLHATLKTLDRLQDDEPQRAQLIETIFHPVPSVDNRGSASENKVPIAWHAARITLFVSWACMGMLVRAVHCNVGRPELWVMLPTD